MTMDETVERGSPEHRQAFKTYLLLRLSSLGLALLFAGAVALALFGNSTVTLVIGLSAAVLAFVGFQIAMKRRRTAYRALERYRI